MRLRNVPGAREYIAGSKYCIDEPASYRGQWGKALFHNENPIHIEIGTGKGGFITTLATENPDINYIGIEKYSSVLIRAIQKREELSELNNLYFIRFDAEAIDSIFGVSVSPHPDSVDKNTEGETTDMPDASVSMPEIDRIYLNFSDPWPKDRHAKRRLTSPAFLSLYEKVLKKDGDIRFKTDNRGLFDYSVEVVKSSDIWHIEELSYDLHASEYASGNVMTEYEEKFSSMGHPIYYFKLKR